ncbi:hypothetical protein Ciccas_010844 [Cichlidogyrus casuarinus]|uniref:Vomeronasal type-1 receptor n=1 Tax=Cichlidogyrus casuarinus TaxID=1844966 RepID=A0ABD2PSY2_9PLAT
MVNSMKVFIKFAILVDLCLSHYDKHGTITGHKIGENQKLIASALFLGSSYFGTVSCPYFYCIGVEESPQLGTHIVTLVMTYLQPSDTPDSCGNLRVIFFFGILQCLFPILVETMQSRQQNSDQIGRGDCLICRKQPSKFKNHIEQDHNILHYFYYFVQINTRDQSQFTEDESRVYALMQVSLLPFWSLM